jgi:small-conductance mechanosensitive channel
MEYNLYDDAYVVTYQQYATLREKATMFASYVKQIGAENDVLKEKLDRNNKVISDYEAESKVQEQTIESLRKQNEELKKQLAEANANLEAKTAETETTCNKFLDAYKSIQGVVLHREMMIKQRDKIIEEFGASHKELKQRYDELKANPTHSLVHVHELITKLHETEEKLRDTEDKLIATDIRLSITTEQLREVENDLQTYRNANAGNVGRLWKTQVTVKDLEKKLTVANNTVKDLEERLCETTKKLHERDCELDYAAEEITKLQLSAGTKPKQYRYKVDVIGTLHTSVYIEYGDRIYHAKSFEDEIIYDDGSEVRRTFHFITDQEIDITDKKCVLKSRNRTYEGNYPITFSQIE